MKLTGKNLGKWGEEQAQDYLEENGVVILGKNVYTEYGEIDLLGLIDNILVFFEVKTSQTRKYGFPEVSVNTRKMDHMSKAAQKFIQEHEEVSNDWRIDVISIEVNSKNETEFKWFKNAIIE